MYDCGFTKGNNWFRYRAAAIIIENGCVLFAGNELEDYYYSVGGAAPVASAQQLKATFQASFGLSKEPRLMLACRTPAAAAIAAIAAIAATAVRMLLAQRGRTTAGRATRTGRWRQ